MTNAPMDDMGRGILAPPDNRNIETGAKELRTLGATTVSAMQDLQNSIEEELDDKATEEALTHIASQLQDNIAEVSGRANMGIRNASNDDDLDDMTTPEMIWQSSAVTLLNSPAWNDDATGSKATVYLVIKTNTGFAAQIGLRYGPTPGMAWRVARNSSGLWQPWQMIRATNDHLDDEAPRRTDLVARAKARRGGSIGTSGLPAVALRFDHHTGDWANKVLPLLEERGLPWAQIINPTRVTAGSNGDTYGYEQLQAAALRSGGELWNHGGNHSDVDTHAKAVREIPTALSAMQAAMPRLAIEGWAPPGLSAGQYMGAAPFRTVEQHTGTYPGRLIMRNHAFVAGYAQGTYRTLDPSIQPIGASHMTIDQSNPGQVRRALDALGSDGFALMLHPNYLDQNSYLSTAELTEILDEIVERRNAGTLQVLSYSGLWLADARSQYRDNLLAGQDATVTGTWGGTWSPYRRENRLGSVREITCEVMAPSGTAVELAIAYDGETITQTHAVSASSSWQKVTGMTTLPLDLEGPLEITIDPGSGVEQRGQALYAV